MTNPSEKAEILHKCLSNPTPPKLKTKHINFHKIITKKTENIKINYNTKHHNNILNDTIKQYEIENSIHELNKDKACGPDKIHNQMLIHGGPPLWNHLTKLFNNCLSNGIFPDRWNFANIHPIPKPNKTPNNPKNYRPIAVSSCCPSRKF